MHLMRKPVGGDATSPEKDADQPAFHAVAVFDAIVLFRDENDLCD
jgi:hypothetical protein